MLTSYDGYKQSLSESHLFTDVNQEKKNENNLTKFEEIVFQFVTGLVLHFIK